MVHASLDRLRACANKHCIAILCLQVNKLRPAFEGTVLQISVACALVWQTEAEFECSGYQMQGDDPTKLQARHQLNMLQLRCAVC